MRVAHEEGKMRKRIGLFRELLGSYRYARELERAIDDIEIHLIADGGDGRVQCVRRADGSTFYSLDYLCNKIKEYRKKALLFDELQKSKNQ